MTNLIPPTCLAMVLCDDVYREPRGKSALVGTFDRMNGSVPFRHPRMAIWVSLTGVRQGMQGALKVVHGEDPDGDPIAGGEGAWPCPESPTDVINLTFFLDNVPFERAGTHFVRLYGGGTLLCDRPFEVVDTSGGESP